MILIDTGPFVALFNPLDAQHKKCKSILKKIKEVVYTTSPVLTEVFHLLPPDSKESNALRDFILQKGVAIWHMDYQRMLRAFELMEQYADHPMDFADASLIVAAEDLQTTKIFTIDRNDFETYKIRKGHRYYHVNIVK